MPPRVLQCYREPGESPTGCLIEMAKEGKGESEKLEHLLRHLISKTLDPAIWLTPLGGSSPSRSPFVTNTWLRGTTLLGPLGLCHGGVLLEFDMESHQLHVLKQENWRLREQSRSAASERLASELGRDLHRKHTLCISTAKTAKGGGPSSDLRNGSSSLRKGGIKVEFPWSCSLPFCQFFIFFSFSFIPF